MSKNISFKKIGPWYLLKVERFEPPLTQDGEWFWPKIGDPAIPHVVEELIPGGYPHVYFRLADQK